jgi:hypothetical protein
LRGSSSGSGGGRVGGGTEFAGRLVLFDLAVTSAAFGEDLNEKAEVGGDSA